METVEWQNDNREPWKVFDFCHTLLREAWNSRIFRSVWNPSRKPYKLFFPLTPLFIAHPSVTAALWHPGCSGHGDTETRCMWLRFKTVCNLHLDWDSAKPETSASLQWGPDSSDCHWQRLSARSFAKNTLRARVRNHAIYPKLKIGAYGERATSVFFRQKKKNNWSLYSL